jgi:predicted nucleic acid-binding protein
MIILDTNVISALMSIRADEIVVRWMDQQPDSSIWTSAVTIFEIASGIAMLPNGRKRDRLRSEFDRFIEADIERRILPFNESAAEAAAMLVGTRRRGGRLDELRDTMIAGIAVAHRATLATHNTRHFDDLPVPVVNPWTD